MTTTERDPAHGGYFPQENEPKEPPMTKTQDELKAAVFSEIEQRARNMPDAPYRDTYVAAMNEAWLLFERHLAALRSPDPEVERFRGSLEPFARFIECHDADSARAEMRHDELSCLCATTGEKLPCGGSLFHVITYGDLRKARAALSSNSGGR